MNAQEINQLKEQLYGAASRRTGTPLQYYELSDEAIATFEREKARIKQEEEQLKQQQKADRAKLNPTRGDVSLQRLTRRSVGDY